MILGCFTYYFSNFVFIRMTLELLLTFGMYTWCFKFYRVTTVVGCLDFTWVMYNFIKINLFSRRNIEKPPFQKEGSPCPKGLTLWYLWKARNDTRFQRKTWNPWQVHHAVEAHVSTHRAALQNHHTDTNSTHRQSLTPLQGTPIFTAGTAVPPLHLAQTVGDPLKDRYLVRHPGLLHGVRCYTDASTSPDLPSPNSRNAGIGLFIINTQVQPSQTIYIKATMAATASVLMAEEAATALAAVVTNCLGFQQVTNPPEWRIKYFTQTFSNFTDQRDIRIYRIQRAHNQTADVLARQALLESQSPVSSGLLCTCSNAIYVQCTLLEALHSVALNFVRLLSAACCW